MLLPQIIHIIIGIYIFLLALRMFVAERDAYFNPLFSAVFKATEPILAPVRNAIRKGPRALDKADFTPLIPIIILVLVDGFVLGILWPGHRVGGGILIRFVNFLDFVFLFFTVLILIFSVFYKYSRFPANPFLRGGFKIMEPFYVGVGKLGPLFREHSGLVLFITGYLAYLILVLILSLLVYSTFADILKTLSWHPLLFVSGIFLHSLSNILLLATFFSYVIIAGALMSWVSPDPMNPVVQIIHLLSEPINRPFRKIIPLIGGIDISPIFSILVLQAVARYGQQILNFLLLPSMPVKPM